MAISGKGGSGKTTLMTLLADEFKKKWAQEVPISVTNPSPHIPQNLGVKN